jgi:hypothetical protein
MFLAKLTQINVIGLTEKSTITQYQIDSDATVTFFQKIAHYTPLNSYSVRIATSKAASWKTLFSGNQTVEGDESPVQLHDNFNSSIAEPGNYVLQLIFSSTVRTDRKNLLYLFMTCDSTEEF